MCVNQLSEKGRWGIDKEMQEITEKKIKIKQVDH